MFPGVTKIIMIAFVFMLLIKDGWPWAIYKNSSYATLPFPFKYYNGTKYFPLLLLL